MSYKTILVHLDAGKRCDTRSALAVRMALDFGAHLTALYAVSPPAIPGYVAVEFGEEFMQSYWRRQAEKGKDICKRFSDHAAKAGLPVAEARVSAEDPVEALQLHARYADLAVVGQHDPDDELAMVPASFPELAVLAAGRPVLLVPYAGTFPSIGERVLVAWSDTREAARAVTDALPLLQRAKKVMVFTVDAGRNGAPAATAGQDISLYLARHGVTVEAVPTQTAGIDIGSRLLSHAADLSADLIVMGAYGHRRLRQLVLGGVTRSLMEQMTVPVLMSH